MFYSAQKVAHLFSPPNGKALDPTELIQRAQAGEFPQPRKGRGGLGWRENDLAVMGRQLSFLRRPNKPLVMTLFVTKGGVLKTSLTLNLARLYALHGLKTLIIGLDLQGDITTCLGQESASQEDDLSEALAKIDKTKGLYDYFGGHVGLEDLIRHTDLPQLDYIAETPELIALDQELLLRPRREYWLKEKVTRPLSKIYDVIILDCSPNWNQLITNSLVATDFLLSPVECRINNYRNLKMFQALIRQCRLDLNLDFQQAFVPTRLNNNRKLSREIGQWYRENLKNCLQASVRESLQGEESVAMCMSLPEYSPESPAALEIKQLLIETWELMVSGRREIAREEHPTETLWQSV